MTTTFLNQVGLILGLVGAILLALSGTVGVISNDASIIFTGLDPMEASDLNTKRVKASHWRNRIFTPIGWVMLAISFLLQLIATF